MEKIKYICEHCGSEDLTFDANAEWDFFEQRFVYVDLCDGVWCNQCDREIEGQELFIEA